jgi:hypothetical protein
MPVSSLVLRCSKLQPPSQLPQSCRCLLVMRHVLALALVTHGLVQAFLAPPQALPGRACRGGAVGTVRQQHRATLHRLHSDLQRKTARQKQVRP